ncbi:hypothetical protein RUM44_011513 [Polyplax serrata]|uniref:Uncharacterized protein n=1 Tax=Polyplax serrata TaxID=468196 RepID=A0ABR1AQB8_POLSC
MLRWTFDESFGEEKSNLENATDFNFQTLNRSKRDAQPNAQRSEDEIKKDLDQANKELPEAEKMKKILEEKLKELEQATPKDAQAIATHKQHLTNAIKQLEDINKSIKKFEEELAKLNEPTNGSTQAPVTPNNPPGSVPNDGTTATTTKKNPVVPTNPLSPSGDSCLLVRLFQQKMLFLQNVLQSIQIPPRAIAARSATAATLQPARHSHLPEAPLIDPLTRLLSCSNTKETLVQKVNCHSNWIRQAPSLSALLDNTCQFDQSFGQDRSNLENVEDFNFGLLNRSKRDTQPSQQTDDEDKIRKTINLIDEEIAQTESTKEKLEQMLKALEKNPQKDEREIGNYKYGIERFNKRIEMLLEEKKRAEKQLSELKAAQSASTQPSPVPNDRKNETTQTKPVITTTPLTPSGDSCLLVRLFQQKMLFLQNMLQSIQSKVTMDLDFLRRMFSVK